MFYYLNFNNRNKYRKKDKTYTGVDLSVVDSFIEETPLSSVDYPTTSTVILSFLEVIKTIDKRKILLGATKNDREEPKNLEWERTVYCLAILSNIKMPTKKIVKELFNEFLDDEETDNYNETLKMLIDKMNTYRYYLKKLLGNAVFAKPKSADESIYLYIRMRAYYANNLMTSLNESMLKFYQDAFSYWNTKKIAIDRKNYSWDEIYTKYKDAESKPNDVRFITQFCKDKGYSRQTAQIYLIVYNNKDCFTSNDLQIITNGQSDFLSILFKINSLTKKKCV